MMRKNLQCLVACFVCMLGSVVMVKGQIRCGSMEVLENTFKRNPALKTRFDLQNQNIRKAALERKARAPQLRVEATTYYIPIVFHVVLTNPNLVTDAQIQAQVDRLNEDYGGFNGDSTRIPAAFKPVYAKTAIQFRLAQRTPSNEATNGIERITTSRSSFDINDPVLKHNSTGGADAWDPNRYFNVWITDLSQNYLGYSTFPNHFPATEEGVAIKYTTLPGNNWAYGKGRTLVHETGHFFSLIHIWGDDVGCSGSDGIDDTPNQGNYTSGCPNETVRVDACTGSAPGVMYENFMDYTDDACMVMFTLDQKDRLEAALSMYHPSLMNSNGADPVIAYNLDAAAKSINTPLQRICSESFTPVITLRNRGAQTLKAVTIKASIDNGPVSTTNWAGSLLSLTETNVTLNAMTVPSQGIHTLNVVIAEPNGSTDENTSNDALTLAFQYYLPLSLPYAESFEAPTYPPVGWDVVNPDLGVTWERTLAAATTGKASVVLRNFDYKANGQKDYLRLPGINISSADSAFMTFQLAAAVVTDPKTTTNKFDTLEVLISKDCGATFTSLYRKGGSDLITRSTATTTSFTPTTSEWRKDSVNLTQFINAGQIVLPFANTNQHENNIFLDDINVYSVTINANVKTKGFMIMPNPTNGRFAVQFYPYPAFLKGINVFSSTGEKVASQIVNGAGRGYYGFDLSGHANGVYIVQVVLGDRVITQKIIKR